MIVSRGRRMKPPLPVGHGQRLCPRGRGRCRVSSYHGLVARPHRAWGRAFSVPLAADALGARGGGGGVWLAGGPPAPWPPNKKPGAGGYAGGYASGPGFSGRFAPRRRPPRGPSQPPHRAPFPRPSPAYPWDNKKPQGSLFPAAACRRLYAFSSLSPTHPPPLL